MLTRRQSQRRPARSSPVMEACEPRRLMSGPSGGGGGGDGGGTLQSNGTGNGDKSPIFDFSDAFYAQNGIDPTRVIARPAGASAGSTVSRTTDPTRRNVRLTAVTGAHDDNGNPTLFDILGVVLPNAFTANAAGTAELQTANKYVAYIFPSVKGSPLSPAVKRQDEQLPLNNGYFSNDPLQIWREAYVNYVPAVLATPAGKAVAADLSSRNGFDADGTPYLKTANDVKEAQEAGIVAITQLASDGSQGPPWFFCDVYKDPSGGAVTGDDRLAVVRNADGTPGTASRDVQALFTSVQNTQTVASGNAYFANANYTFTGSATLDSLTIAGPVTVSLAAGPAGFLDVGSLTLTNGGVLNLGNGALVIDGLPQAAAVAAVTADLAAGSLAGAADATRRTTLGIVANTDPTGAALYGFGTALGSFDGLSPSASAVLVRDTYYGDANLDGRVDGADYARVDAGYLGQSTATPLSGWADGDFNYDGKVDGSDYTLIDNAFNTQQATTAPPKVSVATPTADAAGTPTEGKVAARRAALPTSARGQQPSPFAGGTTDDLDQKLKAVGTLR